MKITTKFLVFSSFLLGLLFFLNSCNKSYYEPEQYDSSSDLKIANSSFLENFENGSKRSYATGDVSFSSGVWTLNDALVGSLTSDKKNGKKSIRVRKTGKITMKFDKSTGAGQAEVKYAVFGSDATSTWELYVSTNSGSSWTKVGSTITCSNTTLATQTFTVNKIGNVRFEIRKISGGSARINFDDFAISDYSSTPPPAVADGDNMLLGNPDGAVTSTSSPNSYLMIKSQYDLSYNNSKHESNWTSWYLGSQWLGSASRQNNFRSDVTLPSGWYHVTSSDYTYSGFDRGHLCPSADRTNTTTDNSATFLMTNMMPQAPNNNRQTWAALENYERTLVNQGNECYIIAGPYGQGGTGSYGTKTTIGNGIVVPAYTWKIIVVLPNGSNDLNRIYTSTRVIAVLIPNTQTCNAHSWSYYRTSVDNLESKTGFDFLSNVPTNIQNVIEAVVDNGPTS